MLKLTQWAVALSLLAGLITVALLHRWPFTAGLDVTKYPHPTIWQLLLADRFTLGLLRLALVALGVYVVVSVPALAVAGRWLKGFGTSGLTADDASSVEASSRLQGEIKKLTDQLDTVTKERNQAIELNQRALNEVPAGPTTS